MSILKILRTIGITRRMTGKLNWNNHLYDYLRMLDKNNIPYTYRNKGIKVLTVPSLNVLMIKSFRCNPYSAYIGSYYTKCVYVYKNGTEIFNIDIPDIKSSSAREKLFNINIYYEREKIKLDKDQIRKDYIKNFFEESTERFKTYCDVKPLTYGPNFVLTTKYENIKTLIEDLNIFISQNAKHQYNILIPKDVCFFNTSLGIIDINSDVEISVDVSEITSKDKFDKYNIKMITK